MSVYINNLKEHCTSLWVFAELRPLWRRAKLQPEVCALMDHTHQISY